MTAAIQKWGNSQGIRIPRSILNDLRWDGSETVELTAKNGKIIIEKKYQRKNIRELFDNYNGNYNPEKIDWGDPVGKEIW